MENISIRTMKAGDIPVLAKINLDPGTPSWSKPMFERELDLPFSVSVAVEVNGRAAGFGVLWIVGDSAQLVEIAVSRDLRRKGYGRRLMEHLMSRARERGCAKMELEYREGNAPAKRLYEVMGFREVAVRKSFYGGSPDDRDRRRERDAVLMECDIA